MPVPGPAPEHGPAARRGAAWLLLASALCGSRGFGVPGAPLPLGWLLHPALGMFQRELGAALSASMRSLLQQRFCTSSPADLIVSFPEAVKNAHAFLFPAGKSCLEIIFLF